jgi:hypothetical protein
MLDIGHWLMDAGHWILVIDSLLLDFIDAFSLYILPQLAVSRIKYPASSIQHLVSSINHRASSIQYQASIRQQAINNRYL